MSNRWRFRRARKVIGAAMSRLTDLAENVALQEMQNRGGAGREDEEGDGQDSGGGMVEGLIGNIADMALAEAPLPVQIAAQVAQASIGFAQGSYNKVKNEMRAEEMIKADDAQERAADQQQYRELEFKGTAADARQEAMVSRAEYDARTEEGKRIEEAAKPQWWKPSEVGLWAANKFLGKDYKTPEGQVAFDANEAAKRRALDRMEQDRTIEKRKSAEEGIEFTKLPGRGSAEEQAALAAAEEKARRAEQEENKVRDGRAGCGCSKEQQGAWAHERNRRSQPGEHSDDAALAANARRNSDAQFSRRVNARTGAAGAARLATLAQMSAAGDSRLLGQSIIDLHQTVKAQGRQMHEATTRKNYSRS